MREILFRGKRKDNGELIIGAYFLMKHNDGRQHYHHFIIPEGIDVSIGTPIEKIQVEVIPDTVGQYTGLTDKNGKKIFEGDIVKAPDGEIFKIEWHSVALSWILRNKKNSCLAYLRYLDMFEIIGNIHDNPELLKEAEQE